MTESASSEWSRNKRDLGKLATNDLYEVLEVSPRASQDVIQAAYRALARTSHPDTNAAHDAAGTMRQLNAAYEVLKDPARRARYDLECLRARRHAAMVHAAASEHSTATASSGPRPLNTRLHHVGSTREQTLEKRIDERTSIVSPHVVLIVGIILIVVLMLLFVSWIDDDPPLTPQSPELRLSSVVELQRGP